MYRAIVVFSLILFFLNSCKKEEVNDLLLPKSDQAELLELELVYHQETFLSTITDSIVSMNQLFPYEADEVGINKISVSAMATVNTTEGDRFSFQESPISIKVTAENGENVKVYSLILEKDTIPNYADLLFNQFTDSNCDIYATIAVDDLIIENNAWNAGNLPNNSYTQCIYAYDKNDLSIVGWEWQYPDNAYGVNAYPQLIYGWKPWQSASSTTALPKKIEDISTLKVNYEVEVTRNDGDYNLAFDNWINSSAEVTPQNILFEFMIWEDDHQLVPFGDFQENVTTTNGTYKFFMGEPDWEPEGSNWTYLAFQRTQKRSKGTVDIDELLSYLINKGIVSSNSYFTSVELGNEIGNSTGKTVIKHFDVEIN
ncbi:hypothetical protein [Flammeovirga sp. SubArs3]|uniref:GH12 family glycosyl hydrolase domain-containing protein n=1 Tax=Flammeovirga sp. SubArs3 TaxID=2995316 RepID=UPI00248B4153|nr:hypothetical protein [Flammeovirga sp. SubArs3]